MNNIKVVHLEINGNHFYFGSKKSLCEKFDKEKLGISYNSLRNIKITPESPYKNSRCIIRVGILVTTRKKPSEQEIQTF